MDEFRDLVWKAKEKLMFGVSETWLNSTVEDGEICIDGYKVFRRDRMNQRGGVLLYVPEHFRCWSRSDLEDDNVQAV